MKPIWYIVALVAALSVALLLACGTVSSDDDDDDDTGDDDSQVDDDDSQVDDDDDTVDDDDDTDDDDDDAVDDDDLDDDDDDDIEIGWDKGDIFPDFTLTIDTDGTASLYDYAGKVRILDTMAAWCPSCKADTPTLQTLWDTYHAQGFEVLQLMAENSSRNTPDVAFLQGWRTTYSLQYVLMIDTNWSIGSRFNDSKFYIPYYAILDQNGVCVHKQTGMNQSYFSYVINDLLTNPPDPLKK